MALTKITSEQVVFKPNAAGSVARKLTDVLSDAVSVKQFGAVGDGVVNDTPSVQAAVDSLSEGGIIYFPSGIYNIASAPSFPSNVFFQISPGASFVNNDLRFIGNSLSYPVDDVDSRYVSVNITNDSVDAVAQGGIKVNAFKAIIYPTSEANGGRHGIVGQVIMNETTRSDNPDPRWVGAIGHVRVNVNQGGTAPTGANGRGSAFAMNPFVYVGPEGTNLRNVTGGEVNTVMEEGSSSWLKTGWGIVSIDKVQAEVDSGITVNATAGSTGYKVGLHFTRDNGGYGVSDTFIKASQYSGQVRESAISFNGISWTGNIFETDQFKVSNNGSLSIGSGSTATSVVFFSDTTSVTADSRILSTGGGASPYSGSLQFDSFESLFNTERVRPGSDNVASLGTPLFRWSVVYAATGSINTSDERLKQDINELSEAEKRVAVVLKSLIKTFKFKDAVVSKGNQARIHVGVIAQDVKTAFENEGLDPDKYALFCYDEWGDEPEVTDDKNVVVKPAQNAGNRYGIRYEELLAFIIAAL